MSYVSSSLRAFILMADILDNSIKEDAPTVDVPPNSLKVSLRSPASSLGCNGEERAATSEWYGLLW